MKPLPVRGVTQITGLSRETLRYYEKVGLLRDPTRAVNGYRLYQADDLERLEFIFKTKKAGFTLREIKELLELKDRGEATCGLGRDIAQKRIQQIERKIASLNEVRAILKDFVRRCEDAGLDEPCSLSFHVEPVLFAKSPQKSERE